MVNLQLKSTWVCLDTFIIARALGDSREFLAPSSNETTCTTSIFQGIDVIFQEEQSLEALILLQKSMLEKQWGLSLDLTKLREISSSEHHEKVEVVC